MKVVIINKSDATGGAAVVTTRLLNALRDAGVDARMLVAGKKHDSPFVELAASPRRIKRSFLAERIKIFIANGFNRNTLFKIDTASDSLPLHRNKYVRNADIVCLNWVNQGMLSLKEIRKILNLGKPIVWTMHDMWNFTGVCHHAGRCPRYLEHCGNCPLLGKKASDSDISFTTHLRKMKLYAGAAKKMHFVAVSSWLAGLARKSSLLKEMPLSIIHNAFPIPSKAHKSNISANSSDELGENHPFRIIMGAARLDDSVKGFPILVRATQMLREHYPEIAENSELITFGNFKNPESIEGIAIRHRHLGTIKGEEAIAQAYRNADVVVSTSLYETLPGTLVEGQVYGCIPVSFNRGGQGDIIDHQHTGYLARWDDDIDIAAKRIADGLAWAYEQDKGSIAPLMLSEAQKKFDAPVIARQYISLFESLL